MATAPTPKIVGQSNLFGQSLNFSCSSQQPKCK